MSPRSRGAKIEEADPFTMPPKGLQGDALRLYNRLAKRKSDKNKKKKEKAKTNWEREKAAILAKSPSTQLARRDRKNMSERNSYQRRKMSAHDEPAMLEDVDDTMLDLGIEEAEAKGRRKMSAHDEPATLEDVDDAMLDLDIEEAEAKATRARNRSQVKKSRTSELKGRFHALVAQNEEIKEAENEEDDAEEQEAAANAEVRRLKREKIQSTAKKLGLTPGAKAKARTETFVDVAETPNARIDSPTVVVTSNVSDETAFPTVAITSNESDETASPPGNAKESSGLFSTVASIAAAPFRLFSPSKDYGGARVRQKEKMDSLGVLDDQGTKKPPPLYSVADARDTDDVLEGVGQKEKLDSLGVLDDQGTKKPPPPSSVADARDTNDVREDVREAEWEAGASPIATMVEDETFIGLAHVGTESADEDEAAALRDATCGDCLGRQSPMATRLDSPTGSKGTARRTPSPSSEMKSPFANFTFYKKKSPSGTAPRAPSPSSEMKSPFANLTFYKKNNPSTIKETPVVEAAPVADDDPIIDSMVRDRLIHFYKIHDPQKTGEEVDSIANKWKDKGYLVLDMRLKEKYKTGFLDEGLKDRLFGVHHKMKLSLDATMGPSRNDGLCRGLQGKPCTRNKRGNRRAARPYKANYQHPHDKWGGDKVLCKYCHDELDVQA